MEPLYSIRRIDAPRFVSELLKTGSLFDHAPGAFLMTHREAIDFLRVSRISADSVLLVAESDYCHYCGAIEGDAFDCAECAENPRDQGEGYQMETYNPKVRHLVNAAEACRLAPSPSALGAALRAYAVAHHYARNFVQAKVSARASDSAELRTIGRLGRAWGDEHG